jgi:hypothetical protein
VSAFTILGVLVFWGWCYAAGWWLGFALDVLVPIFLLKKMDPMLSGVFAGYMELDLKR